MVPEVHGYKAYPLLRVVLFCVLSRDMANYGSHCVIEGVASGSRILIFLKLSAWVEA